MDSIKVVGMFIQRSSFYLPMLVFIAICAMGKTAVAEQLNQSSINFTEIRQYAGFANAAYRAMPDIREFGLSQNYTLTRYGSNPETGIAFYLMTNDATMSQVIAVRGTSNSENAIVDVALKLTTDKRAGVRLHNGFSLTAQAVYADLQPLLKTGYIINTTGHSLGGAVALILGMYLDVDGYTVGKVVTFGQPKVTNIAGANQFQHLNIIRMVTPKDIVPLVPPLDPVDINDIDIYWHAGKEVLLLPDTTYAVLEGINSMLRATKFTQQPLTENNLNEHQMPLYVSMINKKIPVATEVPYKNSLNLFNLFGSEQ